MESFYNSPLLRRDTGSLGKEGPQISGTAPVLPAAIALNSWENNANTINLTCKVNNFISFNIQFTIGIRIMNIFTTSRSFPCPLSPLLSPLPALPYSQETIHILSDTIDTLAFPEF
jgi:hypothetical protein